jgi:hypothetical protein
MLETGVANLKRLKEFRRHVDDLGLGMDLVYESFVLRFTKNWIKRMCSVEMEIGCRIVFKNLHPLSADSRRLVLHGA